jgi:folate-binding protein YgfZ
VAGTRPRDEEDRNERRFVELAGWRTVAVRGSGARGWLNDLVTADVEGLADGRSRRSLLLTPTGRIRADLHVAAVNGSFLLLQGPGQPEAVDAILGPYVLSSDVELIDRSERSVIVGVLGGLADEDTDGALVLAPSVLGSGHDLIVTAGEPASRLRRRLVAGGSVEMTSEDLERWWIGKGIVRLGVDFGPDALPAEAGLEDAIDLTKGCFLGQESVAKVHNLGHPPRILLPVRSRTPIRPGDPVRADGETIGEVTSAAEQDGQTVAIVRVRWDAASRPLSAGLGHLSLRRKG